MKQIWLVHRSKIAFLQPAFYNDVVITKTWVQDFRHSSSRRMYEFFLEGKENPIAKAYTDWVFVDDQTKRPAMIPPEMQLAFFPEGLPGHFPKRDSFPHLPPPARQVFHFHRRVEWREIDSAGLVNNPCYLDYAAECGFQAIAAFHWPISRMMEQGFAIFLREIDIQHLQPAYYGDELEISSWVSDVRRVSATRHYHIRRKKDGEEIARIHTLGVWVNLANGMPVRIPEEMLRDFANNISIPDNQVTIPGNP
jgi:acyl-CoA thioester hydrolase